MGKPPYSMLTIRIIHSAIWTIMVFSIFYILYAGIADRLDVYLWISVGIMAFEGVVLMINRGSCPLTKVAKGIKKNYNDGDDIFLPKWVAIHNKLIFGSVLAVGLIILAYRILF